MNDWHWLRPWSQRCQGNSHSYFRKFPVLKIGSTFAEAGTTPALLYLICVFFRPFCLFAALLSCFSLPPPISSSHNPSLPLLSPSCQRNLKQFPFSLRSVSHSARSNRCRELGLLSTSLCSPGWQQGLKSIPHRAAEQTDDGLKLMEAQLKSPEFSTLLAAQRDLSRLQFKDFVDARIPFTWC